MIITISRRKTMVHTVCFGQLTGIVFFFIVFPQHQLNCRRISLTSIVLQDSIMFMAASHFSLKTQTLGIICTNKYKIITSSWLQICLIISIFSLPLPCTNPIFQNVWDCMQVFTCTWNSHNYYHQSTNITQHR